MRRITFSLATIAVSACFAAAANAYPGSITKATTTSNVTEIDWHGYACRWRQGHRLCGRENDASVVIDLGHRRYYRRYGDHAREHHERDVRGEHHDHGDHGDHDWY